MKTIQINRESRNKLRKMGKSADDSVNRLLDLSDKCVWESQDKTNIAISDETFERLIEYKLSPHETHADTIYRLLFHLK